jgi:hypothetical protein
MAVKARALHSVENNVTIESTRMPARQRAFFFREETSFL